MPKLMVNEAIIILHCFLSFDPQIEVSRYFVIHPIKIMPVKKAGLNALA